MNNDRLRTLAEIRDAIDNELHRGAADGLAPAVAAGASAPKVLGEGEIAALAADRRLVQDALDAQDRYRLTNNQVFELARRYTRVHMVTIVDTADDRVLAAAEVADLDHAIEVGTKIGHRECWQVNDVHGQMLVSRPRKE
jgi:prophage DNA circulation protein